LLSFSFVTSDGATIRDNNLTTDIVDVLEVVEWVSRYIIAMAPHVIAQLAFNSCSEHDIFRWLSCQQPLRRTEAA
jgi:hypothetical protein